MIDSDEIALNKQAVYLKSENSIGGLCWLHTHANELKLDSFTKVTKVAKSVAKGDIHLGKEMTVAVIGVFGETSVYPILVAATCKKETAADSEFTFRTVSEAYFAHPDASQIPLWCWYTDGDPKCRPGGHQYFVTVTLPHDSRLYHLLKDLLGLNLFTGPMTITIGFDWRHIDKRFSTCIRSTAGITINSGHCINRIMLLQWLQRIPNMSLCQAQRLLYPRDAQSVPRALELFQAIIELANLDIKLANPGEEQDFDSIRMLAELLSSLLDPFVKTAWTLSQAVTSLSKFAHLLCAQFRVHRLQFCSNQLYYNSQSMVKNIIFNIAKQQILDNSQPFRIAKDGDNEEEKYFGILQVLGGHCPGMNLKEGLSQMGSADINRVREEHPTWEPGQRRLEATTAEGMDKVNAKTKWDADIIAGNCDLEECWMEGRDQAVKALKSSFFPMDARYYDFETLFADYTSREEDEEDRSMVQEPRPSDMAFEPGVDDPPSTTPKNFEVPYTTPPSLTPDSQENQTDDDSEDHPFEDLLASHIERQTSGRGHETRPTGIGIDQNDFLEMTIGKEIKKTHYLHKQTIVSCLITPHYHKKSHNHLFRVWTFTDANAPDPFRLVNANFTDPGHFHVGDLVLTFAKTKECVSLALVRTTDISQRGVTVNSVLIDTLPNSDAKITLTGQVYCLQSSTPCSDGDDIFWTTNGSYLTNESIIKGTSVVTDKVVLINIPSYLCKVVKPDLMTDSPVEGEYICCTYWRFHDDILQMLIVSLWSKLSELVKPLASIPTLKLSEDFPYRNSEERPSVPHPAIWRYNMIQHIAAKHLEYHLPGINEAAALLPENLARCITLPPEEEKALEIPAHRMMMPLLDGLQLELDWIKKATEKRSTKGKKREFDADTGAKNSASGSGAKRAKTSGISSTTRGRSDGKGRRGNSKTGRSCGRGRGAN
ncbi:hypothetical protein VKT23_014622 [Stygiomarasmius scandens]|uniref:Uncharacterized protein n=1 Tax=Marasmiellus scandens TaxID=2682957 RepID=A0ABR1IZP7_9AGAR